jgi:hypothetical protein
LQLNITQKKIFINGMFPPVELLKELNLPKFFQTNSLKLQGKTQTNSLLMNNSKNLLFTISNWQKQTFPMSKSIPSRSPDLMTGHIVTHHSGKNDL